jgi:hypothetical protein
MKTIELSVHGSFYPVGTDGQHWLTEGDQG